MREHGEVLITDIPISQGLFRLLLSLLSGLRRDRLFRKDLQGSNEIIQSNLPQVIQIRARTPVGEVLCNPTSLIRAFREAAWMTGLVGQRSLMIAAVRGKLLIHSRCSLLHYWRGMCSRSCKQSYRKHSLQSNMQRTSAIGRRQIRNQGRW